MRLIDIINGSWAIRPQMLEEIQRIYASHLHRAEKLDIAAIEAATGKKMDNKCGTYSVDQVAVIPIHGVIGKRMNLMTQISGGVSTDLVAKDFQAAIDDSAIKAIVLHIDSPGGTVDGTQQLADIIASNKGKKPVCACADGMMCSAAYWIGSQADMIVMADQTTDVGSIGVVASHMDISQWEQKQGIKTTEVTAGRYKRAISQYQPLTDEGRAMLQADVNQIYEIFVNAVASGRGVAVEDVLLNMADGRVFMGQKAIDAGLVDSVATLPDTISMAAKMSKQMPNQRNKCTSEVHNDLPKEIKKMTLEEFKSDYPELVSAITAEVTAGHADAIAAARSEGASAELERIKAVKAQLIPGHEALIEQLAMDGVSTASDAAIAIVAEEQKQRTAAANDINRDANGPAAPSADNDASVKTMKRKEFDALDQNARRAFFASGGKLVE